MTFADDEVVLCGASCYTKKYYLNENFESLPQAIKDELKIMCVLYTEEISGTISLVFDEDGSLQVFVDHNEDDFYYDEIGSALKVKQMQMTKRELFEQLETYYRVVFLGEGLE
ncbi:MAG: hypothetical protein HUJ71_00100 [Pseudobutyrivibrio sp.]|nr:hypothetical protein [Pseudobutyrivibrio sp.]